MLSDPVAEAFGLIHHHPSGENFCRVCTQHETAEVSVERFVFGPFSFHDQTYEMAEIGEGRRNIIGFLRIGLKKCKI